MNASTITPPAAKLAKWRKMRKDNNISDELADMSRWLMQALARDNKAAYSDFWWINTLFVCICTIHSVEGVLPYQVHQYRYDVMMRFLALAGKVSPDLEVALKGCL